MQSVYHTTVTGLAMCQVTNYYGKVNFIITNLYVPREERNKGKGSAMLKNVCAQADIQRCVLWAEPAPENRLDYDRLVNFYYRHGFKKHGIGLLRRLPSK